MVRSAGFGPNKINFKKRIVTISRVNQRWNAGDPSDCFLIDCDSPMAASGGDGCC